MMYNDVELARLQAEALFTFDERSGGLLKVNEPDPEGPPPRFFLSRTKLGNLCFTRHDLPAALVAKLTELAAQEPVTDNLQVPPSYMAAYQAVLTAAAPIDRIEAGPAYYLPEVAPAPDTWTITPANASLLQPNYPYTYTHLAERAPVIAVVEDGVAVACCFSARINASVAEAGVHTVEAYRGRGYAARVVRGWASAIRASGRLPLYSTEWENTASQAVATKLGAVLYTAEFSIY